MRDAVAWKVRNEHADFEASERLERAYGKVRVPVLLVWGKCDETLPEATGYKIRAQLPDARMVVMPKTMHLGTIERPRICADLIGTFESQLDNGQVAAARVIQTLDPSTYEPRLLVRDE